MHNSEDVVNVLQQLYTQIMPAAYSLLGLCVLEQPLNPGVLEKLLTAYLREKEKTAQ
jgi:hypothetical protein